MAVVIRLQGLRITAGSQDIRNFFTGLKIPDGGVHIIGGDRDEAFIIFASDEDARRAMTRSGGSIKGSPITLLLSSKAEMQNMLEKSTRNVEREKRKLLEEDARRPRRSVDREQGRRSGSRSRHTSPPRHQRASNSDFLRVFLKGMPFTVTEKDVLNFFSGLFVDEIILLKNQKGQNNGKGFVKFATREDASEGLRRDRKYMGSRYVEVYTTTEEDWHRAVGSNMTGKVERQRSPVRNQRNPQYRARSRSPLAQRPTASSNEEYCVFLENLSYAVEKDDIKKLFCNARLEDDQILYMIGNEGRRTRSAFVLFKSLRDYSEATTSDKIMFFNRWVFIRPISRENMITLLESQNMDAQPPENSGNPCDSEEMCLFVRNLPFDVRKVEIMDFFHGFNVTEDRVFLLHDDTGAGVGKALVLFQSEAEAARALSHNGLRFLGSVVALKCISLSQMRELGVEPPVVQEPMLREEQYSGRSNEVSGRPGFVEHPDLRVRHNSKVPMTNTPSHIHGGYDYEPYAEGCFAPQDGSNGIHGDFGPSVQNFDGPTCIKLVNLPFQIKSEEIYDFCYGYRIIPGSVSLQYDNSGASSATVVFESRPEALTAIEELSGRPIGARKIQLLFV
ncbi:RNA binding motif protein 12Bb [Scomber scombrus]